MTAFDYGVLAIVIGSLALGAFRGFAGELLSLGAWIAGYFAARAGAAAAGASIAQWTAVRDPVLEYVIGFVLVFAGVLFAASIARLLLRRMLSAVGLAPVDRFLGAIFGLGRALLVVAALVLIAGLTSVPRQAWWREARLSAPLETAVLMMRPWLPVGLAGRLHYRTQDGTRRGAPPGAGRMGV